MKRRQVLNAIGTGLAVVSASRKSPPPSKGLFASSYRTLPAARQM